ncbi:MAG: hypothetical protein IJG84_25980 [Kiritimatiellae bacterium]|nr:hypothetical protein [Kiritimatiellia bacterium]
MAVNLGALDAFRSAASWTDKGVANIVGDGIMQNGVYGGRLSAIWRKKPEKIENNAVRTALLKALGDALSLAESTNFDGEHFTSEFMDKLQRLIGDDFKRDDFGIDKNGFVNSGRPLTARRITAILARVQTIADGPQASSGVGKPSAADVPGARLLKPIDPPTRPDALPQTQEARKTFLKAMLPIYHAHEKSFDYGYNYHGRCHATRSFVFSLAMANILREKGVAVDLNAVALGTAGHDTGRDSNGADSFESESRSADNVIAKVDELYPDAAGNAWKTGIKSNITTRTRDQTTIEGYVFKSADSVEIVRLGDLDDKFFPFLREPIRTEDGTVVMPDNRLREALKQEALKLAMATSPRARISREINELGMRMALATNDEERFRCRDQIEQKGDEATSLEREQTDTLTDDEIVDLVENTIRSRPQDFPLLTKYYLNAE